MRTILNTRYPIDGFVRRPPLFHAPRTTARTKENGRHCAGHFELAVNYFAGVSAGLSPAAGVAGADGTDASGLAGAAGAAGTEAAPGTDELPAPGAAGAAPGTCGTERSDGKLCITPESTAGPLVPLWLT